jgi:hypothetical protein
MNGERFWVLRQSLVEAKLGMFADAIKSARTLSLSLKPQTVTITLK